MIESLNQSREEGQRRGKGNKWDVSRIKLSNKTVKENMPIQIGNNKKILSMKLVDIDTKEEMLLFEREGSRCHFSKEFLFGNYIINLRMDWGDIKNGDPVLDADIYRNISGSKGKRIKNGAWHHTEKRYDQDSRRIIYVFNFKNLQLRLMSQISVSMGISFDAILVREGENEP